jgi:hypothetical protein
MRLVHCAGFTAVIALGLTSWSHAADMPVKASADPLPPVSGYVELYMGGGTTVDSSPDPFFGPFDDHYHNWAIGGAGRANLWAAPYTSLQLDIQADGDRYQTPDSVIGPFFTNNFSTLSFLGGGHLNIRDQNLGLFGAFGGVGDVGGNTLTVGTANSGIRHAIGGLEAQYYWGPLTLYGQGGYDSTLDTGNITFVSGIHEWFARATARYFVLPNLMVEGTGEYSNGALVFNQPFFAPFTIPDTSFDTWLWRAKVEWQPGTLPLSFFATYQGSRTNYASNPGLFNATERMTDNRFMAGLRLYMAQGTLLANDRRGATLDIIDPLGAPTSPLMIFPAEQSLPVSDTRLKRDITLISRLDDGLGLYSYRYLWSDTVYVGVMAQEVALLHPDAVVHGVDGYLRVNYSRLGMHLMTWPQWQAASEGRRL